MSDENKDAMQEVLAAIGAWTMHNAQGNTEMADEIFRCLIPQFKDRFPHHKMLSHLCEDAREPLLVYPDSPFLRIYLIANQLSVKLPSGEILFNEDPRLLADILIERGFGPDDVAFADQQEGDRAPSDGAAIALKFRMQETFSSKVIKPAYASNVETVENPEDIIVTGQMKVWDDKKWLLSDIDYQHIINDFKLDAFACKFGTFISRGADVAGRTSAAIYLTDKEMTEEGYVLRFDLLHKSITKIDLDKAPKGLDVTSAYNNLNSLL